MYICNTYSLYLGIRNFIKLTIIFVRHVYVGVCIASYSTVQLDSNFKHACVYNCEYTGG